MQEYDYLMNTDSQGIAIAKDGQALNNNIAEWLSTPEHTVANNPSWGNNLKPYLFEPEGTETAILVEMAILSKMPKDIKGLRLAGIRVTFTEIDLMNVQIRHQFGEFNKTIAR